MLGRGVKVQDEAMDRSHVWIRHDLEQDASEALKSHFRTLSAMTCTTPTLSTACVYTSRDVEIDVVETMKSKSPACRSLLQVFKP